MQRSWAMVLAVIALAGCRSSQQPTNPFLRTTVPPPGTGDAAVVVPGDPYYPGGTLTPSPAVPAVATPVAPAPVTAQPVAPPPRERNKSVPGGDLFYHQSSVDRSRGAELHEDAQPWSEYGGGTHGTPGIAVNAASPGAISLGGPSDAVAQAIALSAAAGPADAASFADFGGNLPGETAIEGEMAEPPIAPVASSELHKPVDTEIRALGSNLHGADGAPASVPDPDRSSRAEPTARTAVV